MDRLHKTSRYFLEHLVPREALDAGERSRLMAILSEDDDELLRGFALEIAESLARRGLFERIGDSQFLDRSSGARFRFPSVATPKRVPAATSSAASPPGTAGRALRPPRSEELEEIYDEVLSAIRLEERRPGAEPGIDRLLALLKSWVESVEYRLFCFLPDVELPEQLEGEVEFLEPDTLDAAHPYRQAVVRRVALQLSSDDPSFRRFPVRKEKGGVYLLPLFLDGKAWGLLDVQLPGRDSQTELEGKLQLLASALSHQIYNQRILSKVVFVDWTTQVYNRTFLEIQLPLEVEKAKRNKETLALLVLDLDDFKKVNDLHGHAQGDQALREFAEVLKRTFRRIDQIFRFGGEEFVVLLPRLDRERAKRAAQRVREAIEECRFLAEGNAEPLRLTASIGGAIFPEDAGSETRLFRLADEACYRAKRGGKNRVIFPDA